jgi:NO-binding membrane sensor protein with MHYT domain
MSVGHNPYLVALSVVIAILGGYAGFALAARVRGTASSRRVLLAGAATLLATSIWTMHFVGMLAAPIPPDAVYLALPTIISFLICALVVGVSLFFVSFGDASSLRIIASALLMGVGIVSMHYVGVHGVVGRFTVEHDRLFVVLAFLISCGAAHGGMRIFLARHGGPQLAFSAIAFGFAVSGMHYTAMYGMRFLPTTSADPEAHVHAMGGPVASSQVLAIIVSVLCFVIAASFLLVLVPEPRARQLRTRPDGDAAARDGGPGPSVERPARLRSLPLGGIGQPPTAPAQRLPLEGADGMHFIDAGEVRSIKADAHYTLVNDGQRERMCPWSISEAEAQLDPLTFLRVHRSHIVAIPHVTFMRKEGDGAIVELGGPTPHLVPVSRPKIVELRARLGLPRHVSKASTGHERSSTS